MVRENEAMKSVIAVVATFAFLPATALGQTKPAPTGAPSSFCKLAVDRVEDLQKDLSQLHADELGDDSAPRASMRAAQTSAKFAEAQVLLTQMNQAHCAPYLEPISWIRYIGEASSCRAAMLTFKSGDSLDACRKSMWSKAGTSAEGGAAVTPKDDLAGAK